MSIRPIETPFPLSPPKPVTRQSGSTQTAPVAIAQRGAVVVADNAGTTDASASTAPAAVQTPPVDAVDQRQSGRSRQELLAAVERAQKIVEPQVRDMAFSIHEKTGQIIVRIIDRESKEVIRQIPGEEMLRIAENIEAMQGGSLPGLLLKQEV
ncbi:MAG: flagellar protein FlaG [Rhodocyclales bacterium]|nr:flagellar protein FlaG [Rhodocyclales bacterium]